MGTQPQQREMWIYLAITWWIGSLAAWLMAWFADSTTQNDDSAITAAALLVLGVSACLRLPVLTVQTPTSSLEDHFVWLLAVSANINWIGFFGLQAETITSAVPALLVAISIEVWLLNEVRKTNCLVWARHEISRLAGFARNRFQVENQISSPPLEANSEIDQELEACCLEPKSELGQEEDSAEQRVYRTIEDGIDPTGRRYLAGEINLDWLPNQQTQMVVVGFTPAFNGDPEVEIEVNCEFSSAQVVNRTPTGMRIQVKRTSKDGERSNLSWYAKQVDCPQMDTPGVITLS
jgi:hypothetical protein